MSQDTNTKRWNFHLPPPIFYNTCKMSVNLEKKDRHSVERILKHCSILNHSHFRKLIQIYISQYPTPKPTKWIKPETKRDQTYLEFHSIHMILKRISMYVHAIVSSVNPTWSNWWFYYKSYFFIQHKKVSASISIYNYKFISFLWTFSRFII